MININLTSQEVAKGLDSLYDLKKITYEFLKGKKISPEMYAEELVEFLEEEPFRQIVYSNDFVEYCINIFEGKDIQKSSKKFNKILKKTKLVLNKEFFEIMNETKDKYGYDFGFIQDQVWYSLYPKYL